MFKKELTFPNLIHKIVTPRLSGDFAHTVSQKDEADRMHQWNPFNELMFSTSFTLHATCGCKWFFVHDN